jgi:hypothetical protein
VGSGENQLNGVRLRGATVVLSVSKVGELQVMGSTAQQDGKNGNWAVYIVRYSNKPRSMRVNFGNVGKRYITVDEPKFWREPVGDPRNRHYDPHAYCRCLSWFHAKIHGDWMEWRYNGADGPDGCNVIEIGLEFMVHDPCMMRGIRNEMN